MPVKGEGGKERKRPGKNKGEENGGRKEKRGTERRKEEAGKRREVVRRKERQR